MGNIVANKVGNTINLFINGKTYQKKFDKAEDSDAMYKAILKAKQSGLESDLKDVMVMINPINKVALNGWLERDGNGLIFLKGFNYPMPELLVNTILEYDKKNYPINALINFWKLLMLNPDVKVRETLFNFLSLYKFAITDNGYFTGYKWVKNFKEKVDEKALTFVRDSYEKLRRWKKAPKNYSVVKNAANELLVLKNNEVSNGDYKVLGNLNDLYTTSGQLAQETKTIYTDCYNQTTRIVLGEAVRKERRLESHQVECNDNGLHVGSTQYIKHFSGDVLLLVLVNPAHVIHIPNSETTKMRTAEYYPYALLDYVKGKSDEENPALNVTNQPYFETDYSNYEKTRLEEDLAKILDDGLASTPSPTQSDYRKVLESRLVDLKTILGEE